MTRPVDRIHKFRPIESKVGDVPQTAVKGVEASLARPAGVAEDTGGAGTDAATAALAPSLTVTGMLGG